MFDVSVEKLGNEDYVIFCNGYILTKQLFNISAISKSDVINLFACLNSISFTVLPLSFSIILRMTLHDFLRSCVFQFELSYSRDARSALRISEIVLLLCPYFIVISSNVSVSFYIYYIVFFHHDILFYSRRKTS